MTTHTAAKSVIDILHKAGFEAFLVGGCVRDSILGKTPKDFDITTNATPDQVRPLFEKTIPVGARFGVVVVMVGNDQLEVATFRSDGAYTDGRRPDEVCYSKSAKEDVERRDFTMNGLISSTNPLNSVEADNHLEAGAKISGRKGISVIDYVNGLTDIDNKIIRCIGDPKKRFEEDSLRMLRAVRFAGQLGFEIETETFKAIQANVDKIVNVSRERIAEELKKLTTGKFAAKGVSALISTGLFRRIFSLQFLENTNTALILERFSLNNTTDPVEGLAMLLADCHNQDVIVEILDSLKLSFKESDTIRNATCFRYKLGMIGQMEEGAVRLFARSFPALGINLFEQDLGMGLYNTIGIESGMENVVRLRRLTHEDLFPTPMVTGADLIKMGFKPSPMFTTVLKNVEYHQLNGDFKSTEQALEYAKKKGSLQYFLDELTL